MKIYVKLTGFHPCESCGEFTQGRLWDTTDRSYEIVICRRCYKRTKRGEEMLRDKFDLSLYEWLIIIALAIILTRLLWVLFLAPDQTVE